MIGLFCPMQFYELAFNLGKKNIKMGFLLKMKRKENHAYCGGKHIAFINPFLIKRGVNISF